MVAEGEEKWPGYHVRHSEVRAEEGQKVPRVSTRQGTGSPSASLIET